MTLLTKSISRHGKSSKKKLTKLLVLEETANKEAVLTDKLLRLSQVTGREKKKVKKLPPRDIFKPVVDEPHPYGVQIIKELNSRPDGGKGYLSAMSIPEYKRDDPGIQEIYRFNNGYGASVIDSVWVQSGFGPKGLEVAVIKFKDSKDHRKNEIVYDTGITADVMPGLNELEVMEVLIRISELPPA